MSSAGGRRKRESTISAAFDFEGLDNVPKLRRLLEIVGVDLLGLENSISRARAVISLVLAGAKLLEVGEHEERLNALEAVVGPRLVTSRGQQGGVVRGGDDDRNHPRGQALLGAVGP